MERSLTKCLQLILRVALGLMSKVALASPVTHVFALIVTNNRSVGLAQPDLQYADDDGARYHQLFRSIASERDVVLLTSFDGASAAVYPELTKVVRAPTRSQVQLATRVMGDAVLQARSRGERTLVYFKTGVMNLTIPGAADDELFVYEQRQGMALNSAPTILERRIAAGPEAVQLALLDPQKPTIAQRGDRLFGSLFAKPYGPIAYAQYLQSSAQAPEPVYGLTGADLSRMHNYLNAMAEQDRSNRTAQGVALIGLGAMSGSFAVGLALDKHDRQAYPVGIGIAGGLGAAMIGTGLYLALSPSNGEQALGTFQQELARSKGNGSLAFVKTEEWLTKMAARERNFRNTMFWVFEGSGVALAAIATINAVNPPADTPNHTLGPAMLYTEAAYFMAMGIFLRAMQTPTERMLNLYHEDPTVKLHLGAVATPHGMSLGLSGAF